MTSNEVITFQVDHLAREGRFLARHVEILLKYLLLVNGHIPHGYEDMRKHFSQNSGQDAEFTKRAKRFVSSADELFVGLADSICSTLVTEVVLVFGGTIYTPKFTVTIELPEKYDSSSDDWNEIVDPSGFPIQLVQNFHHLSRAFDSPPSNIWLLIRVGETDMKNISPVFRIDRRASISTKGHHLRICLNPQPNPSVSSVHPSADCSGFCPMSPLPPSVSELLSNSGLDVSGIMPMSPTIFSKSSTKLADTIISPVRHGNVGKQRELSTVYFTFVHCLKGFRS